MKRWLELCLLLVFFMYGLNAEAQDGQVRTVKIRKTAHTNSASVDSNIRSKKQTYWFRGQAVGIFGPLNLKSLADKSLLEVGQYWRNNYSRIVLMFEGNWITGLYGIRAEAGRIVWYNCAALHKNNLMTPSIYSLELGCSAALDMQKAKYMPCLRPGAGVWLYPFVCLYMGYNMVLTRENIDNLPVAYANLMVYF